MKDVMIVVGAGQISMAIARRMGAGKKIILGDKNIENAKNIQKTMVDAGFDVEVIEMDLSSRQDILKMIDMAKSYGPIKMLVNGAGVSPSQAPIEAILKVDLYGTAVLLEEVGNDCSFIVNSEVGCNISKQPAIGPHFGDIIQIIEFKDEADLKAYPTSKEHQRLLKEGPEMETVTAIDYII